FLAGIFEFGEGLLHARNAHGEGGWLKELSVPRVGTVGYFCSASLGDFIDRGGKVYLDNSAAGGDRQKTIPLVITLPEGQSVPAEQM
ncbi:AvrPphF family type III effector, partial [Pseudomonas syringae]